MSLLVAQHLGTLHPLEQALTIALAFGPFLVLGIVILVRRRAERAEEEHDDPQPGESGQSGASSG